MHAGEEEREHGPHSALQAEGARLRREQEGPEASGPNPPLRHHPAGDWHFSQQEEPTGLHLSARSQQAALGVYLEEDRGRLSALACFVMSALRSRALDSVSHPVFLHVLHSTLLTNQDFSKTRPRVYISQ